MRTERPRREREQNLTYTADCPVFLSYSRLLKLSLSSQPRVVPTIFAICLGLFLIGLIVVMITVIVRDGTTGHWCRHCNGPIPDHLAEKCPLCGKTLERHFVIHKRSPKPFPIWSKVVLWTCLLPLPAAVASEILVRIIDELEVTATQFVPNSGAFESITLNPVVSRDDGEMKVRLTLVNKQGVSQHLDIRPDNKMYETFAADGKVTKHTGQITDALLSQWMSGHGVDLKTKGVTVEIKLLIKQIDLDLAGKEQTADWPGRITKYKVKGEVRTWAPLLLGLGWAAIWLLGCISLIRGPTRHCQVAFEAAVAREKTDEVL